MGHRWTQKKRRMLFICVHLCPICGDSSLHFSVPSVSLWPLALDRLVTPAASSECSRRDWQERDRRWLGNERDEQCRTRRDRRAEIAREQVEVGRIHVAI